MEELKYYLKNSKMNVIYVTVFEGASKDSIGIYETQVLQMLSVLKNASEVLLIAVVLESDYISIQNNINKYNVKNAILRVKKKTDLFKKDTLLRFRNIISEDCGSDGIIICREVLAAAFSLKAKAGLEIVVDKRGLPYLESLEFSNVSLFKKYLRYIFFYLLEVYVFRNCNNYKFVSNEMALFYKNKFKNRIKRYIIQPTGVNQLVDEKILDKWKSGEKLKIIYSGGNGNYHLFNEILNFMESVHNIDSSFEFIICTYLSDNNLKILTEKYPFINFYIGLKHNELTKLLEQSHFGICFRTNSVINKVSAPTKISEYLVYGLKVVFKGSIGSIQDFTNKVSGQFFIFSDKFFDDRLLTGNEQFENFNKLISFDYQIIDLMVFLKEIQNRNEAPK